MSQPRVKLGFWQTARLIWSFARRRAAGRKMRQAQILSRKSENSGTTSTGEPLGCLATVGMVIIAFVLHGMFGYVVSESVTLAVRAGAEKGGKMAVTESSYSSLVSFGQTQRQTNGTSNVWELETVGRN